MKALILAAGYGTRLYPYTQYFPKPLIKVGKKPIIDSLVEKLEELDDLSKIIVVTNDRFFGQFEKWRKSLKAKHKVVIYNDLTKSPEEKLGAVADMALVFKNEGNKEDFLVIGGDNYFHEPLTDFVAFARTKSPNICVGVVDVKKKAEARDYGVVGLNRSGRITKFWEKPARPITTLVAMCLYHFPAAKLRLANEYLKSCDTCHDTIGLYISWLTRKYNVYGFTFLDSWYDVGSHHIYKKLKKTNTKGAR